MLTCCSFANESASPLKESLAYFLVSLYFSLRRVSLAEYFLILRALFPLLFKWSDVLRILHQLPVPCDGWQLGPRVWSLCTSYLMFLLDLTISWHCIKIKHVWMVLQLIASATLVWTWFVITLCFKLWCISMLLRTLCNMWLWLLNLYDLHLYIGWFEIRRGFTDYRVIRA
jgi:hypothetical protein